jgi:hypothetical protein
MRPGPAPFPVSRTRSLGTTVVVALALAVFGAGAVWMILHVAPYWLGVLATRSYLPAAATVQSCEIVRTEESVNDAPVYEIQVRYTYAVDGHQYTSGRAGVLAVSEVGKDAATRRVASFAPGAAVTAWYDPNDPSRAVLVRTPTGDTSTYLLTLFMPPFVLIPVLLAATLAMGLARLVSPPRPGGIGISEREGRTRVRLGQYAAGQEDHRVLPVLGFGGVIVLMIVILSLTMSGLIPRSGWIALAVWMVQLGLATGAAAWMALNARSARRTLVIDPERGTISVPGREGVQEYSLLDVEDIVVAEEIWEPGGLVGSLWSQLHQGNRQRLMPDAVVRARLKSGAQGVVVARWTGHFAADAREFADWLCWKLGLPGA